MFRMRIISDEYGKRRGMKTPYIVILTPTAWGIIKKNLPMKNGDTVTHLVYAWDILRRNKLLVRFENLIETANETGQELLNIVCNEINFLIKIE